LSMYDVGGKRVTFNEVFVTDGNPRRIVRFQPYTFASGYYRGIWRDNDDRFVGEKGIQIINP
jgi:hypothetical protein